MNDFKDFKDKLHLHFVCPTFMGEVLYDGSPKLGFDQIRRINVNPAFVPSPAPKEIEPFRDLMYISEQIEVNSTLTLAGSEILAMLSYAQIDVVTRAARMAELRFRIFLAVLFAVLFCVWYYTFARNLM